MKTIVAALILSVAGASGACAAVIQFDHLNGPGPAASANAVAAQATTSGPKIRALATSVGGGAIGLFIAPPKPVRPATAGGSGVVPTSVSSSGPIVAPLPGALALLLAGVGVLFLSVVRRRVSS